MNDLGEFITGVREHISKVDFKFLTSHLIKELEFLILSFNRYLESLDKKISPSDYENGKDIELHITKILDLIKKY